MSTQEDIIRTFRKNIAAFSQDKKITLEELDLSSLDKARLDNIMKGVDDEVDLRFFQRIADAFGIASWTLVK